MCPAPHEGKDTVLVFAQFPAMRRSENIQPLLRRKGNPLQRAGTDRDAGSCGDAEPVLPRPRPASMGTRSGRRLARGFRCFADATERTCSRLDAWTAWPTAHGGAVARPTLPGHEPLQHRTTRTRWGRGAGRPSRDAGNRTCGRGGCRRGDRLHSRLLREQKARTPRRY